MSAKSFFYSKSHSEHDLFGVLFFHSLSATFHFKWVDLQCLCACTCGVGDHAVQHTSQHSTMNDGKKRKHMNYMIIVAFIQ